MGIGLLIQMGKWMLIWKTNTHKAKIMGEPMLWMPLSTRRARTAELEWKQGSTRFRRKARFNRLAKVGTAPALVHRDTRATDEPTEKSSGFA